MMSQSKFMISILQYFLFALVLSSSALLSQPLMFVENKDEGPDFYIPSKIEDDPHPPIIEPLIPELINLEKKAQDFILETKQIEIPGYPNSFNPSITRWRGNLLMAFRIREPKTQLTNQMGLVWLDENFNLASDPYILHIPPNPFTAMSKEQDPRLITIGDRLIVVYSNMIKGETSQYRRVFLSDVHFEGDLFYTDQPECLCSFESVREERWEKNWVPFEYKGELLLAYSLTPHRIFQLLGNGKCKTVSSTLGMIQWNWGNLRGGTQALLDNGQYLSFFHSSREMKTVHSNGKQMPHYFMGAYTFSSEPPFEITNISPEPIVGNNFYSAPPYKTWKPLRVVFPGGLIIDEKFVWVLYGRQDFEVWVAKFDKKALLNSLIPVNTILRP